MRDISYSIAGTVSTINRRLGWVPSLLLLVLLVLVLLVVRATVSLLSSSMSLWATANSLAQKGPFSSDCVCNLMNNNYWFLLKEKNTKKKDEKWRTTMTKRENKEKGKQLTETSYSLVHFLFHGVEGSRIATVTVIPWVSITGLGRRGVRRHGDMGWVRLSQARLHPQNRKTA